MGSRLGVMKVAASKLGLSYEEYIALVGAGKKHCRVCRTWKSSGEFGVDRSRGDGRASLCSACHNAIGRDNHAPKYRVVRRGGSRVSARDGDKLQARRRVNYLKEAGVIQDPKQVQCIDCGHLGSDRRHEYDHHRGYAADNHEVVDVVCSKCHAKRERQRGVH